MRSTPSEPWQPPATAHGPEASSRTERFPPAPTLLASAFGLALVLGSGSALAGEPRGGEGDVPQWLIAQAPSRAATQAAPAEIGQDLEPPPEDYELETVIGGAVRFNVFYKTWQQPLSIRSSGNDVAFDTFRIDVESSYGPLELSAEYRFYAGYNMLHHAWLGYRLLDLADLKVGLLKVPFGALPYASTSYFLSVGYYVGLEDDYDLGGRADIDLGPVDVQLAYFRNDEGSYSGTSIDSARYSYDVARTDASEIPALAPDGSRQVEERDQANARVTWSARHGDVGSTEVGLSGQYGRLVNDDVDDGGYHLAGGAHLRGQYGPIGTTVQVLRYAHEPNWQPGEDRRWMAYGAFDAPYRVASAGWIGSLAVSYRFDLALGPLESVTLYEEYGHLVKLAAGYADTQQLVSGALFAAGPLYLYLDVVAARNHPFVGSNYVDALAEGSRDAAAAWRGRINGNLGFYF